MLDVAGRGRLRGKRSSARGVHMCTDALGEEDSSFDPKQRNRKGCGRLELDMKAVVCHRILDPHMYS